jgi:aminopeptidase N
MTAFEYDGYHIKLKTQDLAPGTNRIEIVFSHPYNHDGNGLHRFEDPVDHRVYLYSNFEPYQAHLMFPCFDQPDLKSSYELTVEAPEEWQIISNTMEREVSHVDGRNSWAFPPSPLLSTYVFALAAGPFHSWQANANGIPMRLFARESLAPYVEADRAEWFDITAKGLDYFGVTFGYPYPYSKYDQILVPDFNAGAMENAGAVTFGEEFVFRSRVAQDRRRERANTILHEMAHMWFGDLVTMRWWNGLWLNESFASYMATRAVDQATKFKGSWLDFFADVKHWAYFEDQLVTTHPIEVPVPNTDVAKSNFDGITYGKGAAALKQLNHFLGDDDFQEGLQRYFQKYALKNTTINDFFRVLSEASGKDLNAWQKVWIQTAGVNTLEAKWSCKDDKIEQFSLLQGSEEDQPKILRPHRTQVALYQFPKKNNKTLTVSTTAAVSYFAAETPVSELVGKPCPTFVFPNHQDYDYVKVTLDPVSLESARQHLMKIEDPLARQMIWSSLWQMVSDGKMPAKDLAELVMRSGAKETDAELLSHLLRWLMQTHLGESSIYKFLPESQKNPYLAQVEEFLRKNLLSAPAGSDLQLNWYHAFLRAASSPESLKLVQNLLNGKTRLRNFKVEQERRWELIQTLARNNATGAAELIATELKNDPTDLGRRSAVASQASLPNTESKKSWLNRILRPLSETQTGAPPSTEKNFSLAELRSAMRNFQLVRQEELSQGSIEAYFGSIPKLSDPAVLEYAQSFAGAMYPSLCDPQIIQKTQVVLEQNPNLPASVIKTLKMHKQQEEKCLRARAKSGG